MPFTEEQRIKQRAYRAKNREAFRERMRKQYYKLKTERPEVYRKWRAECYRKQQKARAEKPGYRSLLERDRAIAKQQQQELGSQYIHTKTCYTCRDRYLPTLGCLSCNREKALENLASLDLRSDFMGIYASERFTEDQTNLTI